MLPVIWRQIEKRTNTFECLPIVQDAALLQNILYSGVWTRFDAAFAAKQEGQT